MPPDSLSQASMIEIRSMGVHIEGFLSKGVDSKLEVLLAFGEKSQEEGLVRMWVCEIRLVDGAARVSPALGPGDDIDYGDLCVATPEPPPYWPDPVGHPLQ
jgi:hypothetical protein